MFQTAASAPMPPPRTAIFWRPGAPGRASGTSRFGASNGYLLQSTADSVDARRLDRGAALGGGGRRLGRGRGFSDRAPQPFAGVGEKVEVGPERGPDN